MYHVLLVAYTSKELGGIYIHKTYEQIILPAIPVSLHAAGRWSEICTSITEEKLFSFSFVLLANTVVLLYLQISKVFYIEQMLSPS